MILTHLTLGQSVNLSRDLLWIDEHGWSPVVSTVAYTLTGAMLIETGVRQGGRFITLNAPDASMAWHTRSVVDTLALWAGTPGQQFTLLLDDGRGFTVVFRHQEGAPMDAKPVRGFPTYDAADWWQVSLKFMEI